MQTLLLLAGLLGWMSLSLLPAHARRPPTPASPAPAPDPQILRQQQLSEARQQFATQNYQQAYDLLNTAYQQQKQPTLLIEMCLCQIALGRADDAEQILQQYEREAVTPSPSEQESLTRCKDLTRRQRLVLQGVQQCNSDKYRDGIRNLAEADRIVHAPDLLLNIGLCYIKDRNLAEAGRACEQFKQEVPTRSDEQSQSLADCEKGVALLREFNRCRDLFQQRAYGDSLGACQGVQKSALDEDIRSQSLLRVGYSQARLGQFRPAQESCAAYERTQAARDEESSRLLADCKDLVQRGLAPPPPPAPPKDKTTAWYKRWWVWALVGTAAGAAAVGLGAGLAKPSPAPEHLTITWDALTQPAH